MILRLRFVLAAAIRALMPTSILPVAQADILLRLNDNGPTKVSDLAAMTRLAVNTVSTIINQLESGGLIERNRSSADRRVVLIELTSFGLERLDEWLALTDDVLLTAIERLSDESQDRVREAIPVLMELAASVGEVYTSMEEERGGVHE